MKRLINFNDFLFDKLHENKGGKILFIISDRLKELLLNIDDDISNDLISLEDGNGEDITLVDISNTNNMVKISLSSKILSDYERNDKIFNEEDFYVYHRYNQGQWDKFRSDIKIGKLIKKLLENKYNDTEIDQFVKQYKAEYDTLYSNPILEIINGDDIPYWYDYHNYKELERESVLHNSCMANQECADYLDFYSINSPNKVQMLVMYENDKKEKITARALIWHLDLPEGRTYMDRVYYIYEEQTEIFKKYAKDNGWLYKKYQNSGNAPIVDSVNNQEFENFKMVVNDIKLSDTYPYLDTLYYLYQDNKLLSNINLDKELDEIYVKLFDTEGGVLNGMWSEFYNKYINDIEKKYVYCELLTHDSNYYDQNHKYRLKEDATFFPYYNKYAPDDKFTEKDVVETTHGEKFKVFKHDAIYLKYYKEYTTLRYAEKNMVYSRYYKDYIDKKDYVESYDGYNIFLNKAEKVFLTEEDSKLNQNYQFIPEEEIGKLTYIDDNGNNILK